MNRLTEHPEGGSWRQRHRRPLQWIALTLLVGLALLWIFFDWNWFKRPLESLVEARTGRTFQLQGDLDVDLGRIIGVDVGGFHLGNPAGAEREWMATSGPVRIDVAFWPLWRGRFEVERVTSSTPDIWLETGKDGNNWDFGLPPSSGEPNWQIRQLWVEGGRLRFSDAPQKTQLDISLDSVAAKDQAQAPALAVDGDGQWRGNDFKLAGQIESPLELTEEGRPYRIDLRASAGATHARARGTLTDPFQLLQTFDLQLALRGQDLEDLYPLLGLALPPTAPYAFDGRLQRDVDQWRYNGFKGKVGDSDLAGDVHIDAAGKRPYFRAQLVSQRLDFDDLAGFVGAAPSTSGNETANAEQKALKAQQAASVRLLPETPYDLDKLHAMDADVRWQAHRIEAPQLPIDDMDAHLLLEGGLLKLQPLNFGVADGDIRATIQMDARKNPIVTHADIAVRKLDLPKLLPDSALAKDAIGRIGGDIKIRGQGNSIAAIFGSADGDIALGMGRGQISNLIMELAGLDIAESLRFLIGKDRQVPIRCAFADFSVKDGMMQTRAFAFDSTDTIIIGEGSINLKDEHLDLLLRPRPKDRSLLSLRSPLRLSGTFKQPTFRPDLKALGMRGAIALALAPTPPPAALLATFESGPGEDSNCGGEYAR